MGKKFLERARKILCVFLILMILQSYLIYTTELFGTVYAVIETSLDELDSEKEQKDDAKEEKGISSSIEDEEKGEKDE